LVVDVVAARAVVINGAAVRFARLVDDVAGVGRTVVFASAIAVSPSGPICILKSVIITIRPKGVR